MVKKVNNPRGINQYGRGKGTGKRPKITGAKKKLSNILGHKINIKGAIDKTKRAITKVANKATDDVLRTKPKAPKKAISNARFNRTRNSPSKSPKRLKLPKVTVTPKKEPRTRGQKIKDERNAYFRKGGIYENPEKLRGKDLELARGVYYNSELARKYPDQVWIPPINKSGRLSDMQQVRGYEQLGLIVPPINARPFSKDAKFKVKGVTVGELGDPKLNNIRVGMNVAARGYPLKHELKGTGIRTPDALERTYEQRQAEYERRKKK